MRQLTDDALAFAIAQFAAAEGHDPAAPTPCADWTLRELTNHTVAALGALADVLEGADVDPARTDPAQNAGVACDDAPAALRAVAPRLSAVAADEQGLDRRYSLRGMELPGRMVLQLAITDAAVHAWDVAVTRGAPAAIPPEVAAPLLAFSRHFAEGARGRAFGPEVSTASGDPSVQLVALLGRTP